MIESNRLFDQIRIAPKSLLEKSDQQLREDLLNKLVDSRLMGPTAQLCFGHDPKQLPMRELPHGCYWNVYMMYTAYCRMMGEEPAGKSLFYSTVRAWDSCLKFHKKTVHSQCWQCAKLNSLIRQSTEASLKQHPKICHCHVVQ